MTVSRSRASTAYRVFLVGSGACFWTDGEHCTLSVSVAMSTQASVKLKRQMNESLQDQDAEEETSKRQSPTSFQHKPSAAVTTNSGDEHIVPDKDDSPSSPSIRRYPRVAPKSVSISPTSFLRSSARASNPLVMAGVASSVIKAKAKLKNRVEAKGLQKHRCIIDPQMNSWVRKWDGIMLLALAFTMLVTPVEVAFLDEGEHITALWWANRVIDLIFLMDLILTFNLAYQEKPEKGGHYVYNRYMITTHYLKGWFTIDLFSVLPFFLITLNYSDPWGNVIVADDDALSLTGVESQTRVPILFRVVKLLRMLKLSRVFKASRVFERTVLDIALHKWELTYAVLKLAKLVFVLCLYAHLQACMWGLLSAWMTAPNWISEFETDFSANAAQGRLATPLDRYAAALYWSVMTLTSIGYGDFVPVNTAERYLCSAYMLLSGVLWTYVIGSVAAIATTLNPNQILYEQTMDQCVSCVVSSAA